MRRLLGWGIQHALSREFQIVSGPGGVGLSDPGAAGGGALPKTEETRVERCEILSPRDIRADDCLLVFRDHASALGFLSRLAAAPRTMQALRGALLEDDAAPAPHRMSDHEVLVQLAWRLAGGGL